MVHGSVMVGAFVILWFLALFCLLPIGIGSEIDKASGAPSSAHLGSKALAAGVLAAVLWIVFYALMRSRMINL